MPLLRGRDRHKDATRYQMREKLLAIGDDSWIETGDGQRVFKVNGKALRIRDTLVLESPTGDELYSSGDQITSFNHFSGLTVANGRVYIGTYDGTLYCFGLEESARTQ